MKKIIGLFIIFTMIVMLAGCDYNTAPVSNVDEQQQAQQEQMLANQNNEIGMPDVHNNTEKKMAKMIYELRDNPELICYAYTKNEMSGKYIYEGRCMGFGLPYATQYSNPEKFGTVDGGEYGAINPYTMPQAEPNGLFMPNSAAATWIMMINEETGKVEVQYYEPNIVVTQTKKPSRLCETWSLPENY